MFYVFVESVEGVDGKIGVPDLRIIFINGALSLIFYFAILLIICIFIHCFVDFRIELTQSPKIFQKHEFT